MTRPRACAALGGWAIKSPLGSPDYLITKLQVVDDHAKNLDPKAVEKRLGELAHNQWWGSLLVLVAGDPPEPA